jgi:hypothetical protein
LSPSNELDVLTYLDTNDESTSQLVFDAVDQLAIELGYSRPETEVLERGSFWRKAKAKIREGLSSDVFRRNIREIEYGLRAALLDERQAEIDAKKAEAISSVLSSIENVSNVCIQVGSILIVKVTSFAGDSTITARTMTPTEVLALSKLPEVQRDPRKVIDALGLAAAEQDLTDM